MKRLYNSSDVGGSTNDVDSYRDLGEDELAFLVSG